MTFSFEDGFESINEAMEEVKEEIFRVLWDPLDLIQLDWTTQQSHTLDFYNVTFEEEDKDPRNIKILETEGHREFEGLQIENPDIITPLKTRQVNIGTKVEMKFAKIVDYWDDTIVDKVVEFLREYQDLFPTKFSDIKGIIGDLGVMKITLKSNVKPIKQRPYPLNLKYKESVHLELDKMLVAGIIEPVEESDWFSILN